MSCIYGIQQSYHYNYILKKCKYIIYNKFYLIFYINNFKVYITALTIKITFWTVSASELQSLSYPPPKKATNATSSQRTAKIPSHHIRLKWAEGQRSEFCLFEEWGKEVLRRGTDGIQIAEGNALTSVALLYFRQPHPRKQHEPFLIHHW